MADKNYSISYSWQQNWQPYKFQSFDYPKPANTNAEMIRIEAVDNIIDAMKSYPDAEAILNKILSKK